MKVKPVHNGFQYLGLLIDGSKPAILVRIE